MILELFHIKQETSSDNISCFRAMQLEKLRRVMVKDVTYAKYTVDPNEHYVLTMDNAKKILAIHQRLRYLNWYI